MDLFSYYVVLVILCCARLFVNAIHQLFAYRWYLLEILRLWPKRYGCLPGYYSSRRLLEACYC